MKNEFATLSQRKILQAMNWAYDKAVNGIPGLDSAEELAACYLKKEGSLKEQIDSLIRWQNTKAGTSGFVTGLGGMLTLPATLPANITSVLYIQIRMIAAIAKMCGFDLRDDKVRTLVYVCLVGSSSSEIIKNIGIQFGEKIAVSAIKDIPRTVITKINQAVGFKLLTKFGQKGLINLGKAIPLFGGVIGGAFDVIATNTVGNTARNLFMSSIK